MPKLRVYLVVLTVAAMVAMAGPARASLLDVEFVVGETQIFHSTGTTQVLIPTGGLGDSGFSISKCTGCLGDPRATFALSPSPSQLRLTDITILYSPGGEVFSGTTLHIFVTETLDPLTPGMYAAADAMSGFFSGAADKITLNGDWGISGGSTNPAFPQLGTITTTTLLKSFAQPSPVSTANFRYFTFSSGDTPELSLAMDIFFNPGHSVTLPKSGLAGIASCGSDPDCAAGNAALFQLITAEVVPEPATLLLVGSGAVGLWWLGRRVKRGA